VAVCLSLGQFSCLVYGHKALHYESLLSLFQRAKVLPKFKIPNKTGPVIRTWNLFGICDLELDSAPTLLTARLLPGPFQLHPPEGPLFSPSSVLPLSQPLEQAWKRSWPEASAVPPFVSSSLPVPDPFDVLAYLPPS